jgi:quercetin dioxygenase-like cupin family protein
MIPDDVEALALADSVGALDPDEQRELAARMAQLSPEERAEVARLYDTAAAVALTTPAAEPPPHVRERVLAAARTPGRYTLWGSSEGWSETGLPGIRVKVLAVDKVRLLATLVIQADPGAVYPSHRHHGPEECYVLRGSVVIDGRVLGPGDFHHADEGSDHGEITTVDGAEVLLVGAIEDYLPGV